jgi:translocator protein
VATARLALWPGLDHNLSADGCCLLAWQQLPDSASRARLGGLFALNAGLNVLWSFLFFNRHRPDLALWESVIFLISIAHLLVTAGALDTRAAWALTPYLLWVSFATVLNATIVKLNPTHDALRTQS